MPYYRIKINHVSLNCVMAKSFHLETYRFLRGERVQEYFKIQQQVIFLYTYAGDGLS